MSRKNVQFTTSNGNLGRNAASEDGTTGFIFGGVAVSGKLVLGTIYQLKSANDLDALGVDAAYDSTNAVLVYHHVTRFFDRNPNATLYLMVVAQSVTLTQMADKANAYLKKMSKDKEGKIKLFCINLHPLSSYTPTLTTGLDADVIAAIPKAQETVVEEAAAGRYIDAVIIGGYNFNGTATNALDIRTKTAPKVSVCIAQDPAVAALKAEYAKMPAVGDCMGMLSKAAVSQDFGELIDTFNLKDDAKGYFQNCALSSGSLVSTYSDTDLDTLDSKGYIFAEPNTSVVGSFFNDTHTCSAIANNDYAYIENNRTINKMIRLVAAVLAPKIKSRVPVDSTNGKIKADVRVSLQNEAIAAMLPMENEGDLSGGRDCYIDPDQNVISTSKVNVKITAVPVAIAREVSVTIGFSNPFKG
jgi:hypothetical protein